MRLRAHVLTVLQAAALAGGGLLLMAAPGFPETGGPGADGEESAASDSPVRDVLASHVPGEILVRFKPGVSAAAQALSISSAGALASTALSEPGWVHVKLPEGQAVAQALAAYRADPNVAVAQPNYVYHASVAPNDASYGAQWAMKNTGQAITSAPQPGFGGLYAVANPGIAGNDLNVESAWDHITDCSTVTVAVLDTGVNYSQADLAASMWNGGAAYPGHGWDYVGNDSDPMDLMGHGTHIAGIIGAAGNNGSGTAGVCWKASIMAVRVLDATGSGTSSTVIQGVSFAVTNGARVINMSFGGPALDIALSDAITTAQNAGALVVAAAGNSGADNDYPLTPTYPCDFVQANLICVAALDQGYQLAAFSNYGAVSVDVGAPGANVLSTWTGSNALATDALTAGWTFSTTTSGGWAYQTIGTLPALADAAPWQTALYNNATDDRAYKAFNLTGNAAVLEFSALLSLAANDHFRTAYRSAGGDPFAGGVVAFDISGISTLPTAAPVALDISPCIGATCSVGFQLTSDAATQSYGAAASQFRIRTLTLNTASYNTLSGTSMAAPHVAGLAAMVLAFNPQYTYGDAISAIVKGGRPVAALTGKTASGRAADALGALSYINPPAGLAATVQ